MSASEKVVLGFVVVIMMLFLSIKLIEVGQGLTRGDAVDAGVGEYSLDPETGEVEFKFKEPTAMTYQWFPDGHGSSITAHDYIKINGATNINKGDNSER